MEGESDWHKLRICEIISVLFQINDLLNNHFKIGVPECNFGNSSASCRETSNCVLRFQNFYGLMSCQHPRTLQKWILQIGLAWYLIAGWATQARGCVSWTWRHDVHKSAYLYNFKRETAHVDSRLREYSVDLERVERSHASDWHLRRRWQWWRERAET